MRLLVLLFTTLILSAPVSALRLEPLPDAAAWPASGPPLNRDALISLSLELSGAPAEAVAAYKAVLDRWDAEGLEDESFGDFVTRVGVE